NPTDAASRVVMVRNVLDGDREAVVEYRKAREAAGKGLDKKAELLADTKRELKAAVDDLKGSKQIVDEAKMELAVFSAGSQIVIHGFVFPVDDPHNFVDT